MFCRFRSALLSHGHFSSGEAWFEEEEIAGSILTLLRNFAIGDVGVNAVPSARRIAPTCFLQRQQVVVMGKRRAGLHGVFPITKLHDRLDPGCDEARFSESSTINLLAP
jgi:hypothetical protein